MNKELENKLIENYPKFFSKKQSHPSTYGMFFGCECGDGWYDLLDSMCKELEPYEVYFRQIKEKFGSLRVYYTCVGRPGMDLPDEEAVVLIIGKYEMMSDKICEVCGNAGERTNVGNWIQCLCKTCQKDKRKNENRNI